MPGTPSVAPCTPGEKKNIRKEKNIDKNVLQAVHTHRRQDQRGHQGDSFFMASRMFVVMKLAHYIDFGQNQLLKNVHKSLGRGPLSKNWLFIAKCDLQ